MRDHNKAFCRLAAQAFDCPGPVYEFGSYQVEGQVDYANLRGLFPGKTYVGCDFRQGPGVDRVEDVTAINLPDASVGTVLCIETFEHVFDVHKAFDEVFRVLKPGGLFLITSPFNFRIHGYPDDYWRMTPSCLRRKLSPYGARLSGYQGHVNFPHTVMAVAMKSPVAADFSARAERFRKNYAEWNAAAEQDVPFLKRLRKQISLLYRSKGERHFVNDYHHADFILDAEPAVSLAKVG